MSENLIKVVVPRATTNLVTNPSFETGTTSWSNHLSSTISQSTEQSRWGRYSLKVIASGSTKSGAKTDNFTNLSGDDMVVSAWVYAPASQAMKLIIHDVDLASDVATNDFTGTGAWQFVELSYDSFTATNDMYILIGAGDAGSPTFYVDGVMYEEWSANVITVATTYCDGDQPGCEWTGVEHASTSTRDAVSRAGGELLSIDSNASIKMRHLHGFGTTRYQHHTQDTIQPGSIIQSIQAEPRVMTILMAMTSTTRANYHSARQELINRIKPHRTKILEPALIQYDAIREIAGYYDAGLESALNTPYKEQFGLRFVCYDPFWYQIGNNAKTLSSKSSQTTNYIIGKKDGVWDDLDTGTDAKIRALAYHTSRNTIIVGGDFGQAGSPAVTDANFVAEYNPTTDTWVEMDNGTNGQVNDVAIGPDGKIYVVGTFTSVGSGPTSANRIAVYDPGAGTWAALGTGASGEVTSVSVGEANRVWIGGNFVTAGGVTCNNVAYWDGSAWNAMDSGTNGQVNTVDAGPAGVLIGGAFTTVGSGATTANRVAIWGIDAAAWSVMGTGVNGTVNAIIWSPDSLRAVATGAFTTADGATATRIAEWNGVTWNALATGLNDDGYSLFYDTNGILYVGGLFTTVSGDDNMSFITRWTGSGFTPIDVDLPVSAGQRVEAITMARDDLYLGFHASGTADHSASNTITNNGTARAYPQIVISRSGGFSPSLAVNINTIINETTGKELLFNLSVIDGEEITIDLTPGNKKVFSNHRKNLISKVISATDFAEFSLLPGANQITAYVSETGAVTVDAYVKWRDTYESFD